MATDQATSDVTAQLVKSVVTAVSSLEPFPVLSFMQRLYNKARLTPNAAAFRGQLPPEPHYGPDDGLFLNNIDETDRLQKLAAQCIVGAVSLLDDNTDKAGFRACVQSARAVPAINDDIALLTSLLFAEHVNFHLAGYKAEQGNPRPVPSLDELMKTAGFVAAFAQKLGDTKFIKGEIYSDMARGNHAFSMALLFILQYLRSGPGFTPLSASAFQSSPARQVLMQWASELVAVPQTNVSTVFSFITHVASGVLLPDPTVTPMKARMGIAGRDVSKTASTGDGTVTGAAFPVGALSSTIMDSVIQPAVSSLVRTPPAGMERHQATAIQSDLDGLEKSDVVEYQTIAIANQAQWNGMGDRWLKAVSQAANFQTQYSRTENEDFAHGFAQGLSFGIAGGAPLFLLSLLQDVVVTTTTGQALADWMAFVRASNPELFTNSTPNTVSEERHRTTPAGNCFVAGTKVATDKGEINIEDITEGTRILTEATAGRYGIASDEDVVSPPPGEGKTMLVGFNNKGVFASAGHIFFTTTGPRAIEPEIAMRENSFADVGRLRQGHALYRLSQDARRYQVVPIKSIQIEFVGPTHLHGVHLREGDRSYHANGYQVAINYPEITIKSIARALSQVPRHQAVKMLHQIDELAPVFQKIGVPGVATLLRQELRDARRNRLGPPLGPVKRQHARRYQGVNCKDLERTWTLEARDSPLTDKHGPRGYKLPVVNLHEGVLHLDHDIVPRVAFDTKGSMLRWSRALGGVQGYEHGLLNFTTHGLLGRGAVYISQHENPSDLPKTCETVVPFVARKAKAVSLAVRSAVAAPAPVAPSPAADPGTIDREDFYDVVVDAADWPANTTKTSATQPLSMGQVAIATYHSDGKGSLEVPVIVVPALDDLLGDINKTRPAESQLGPLYQSTVLVNKKGTLTGTVTFTSSSTVALLSDQAPKTESDSLPVKNLTFSKLKSAVTIPILYQSAKFAFSWDYNDISGAVYELNPAMVGNKGQRHWFGTSSNTGQATGPSMRAALAVRLADAQTATHTKATRTVLPAGSHVGPTVASVTNRPAPVTRALIGAQPLTVEGIASLPGYSEDAVHKQSQTILQNMLFYHMDESDRTTFLTYPKPRGLPLELAENLAADLKTWIHDTYAPAYVSFMLSQVSPGDSSGWRVNFNDAEKDKIWYWWSGSGSKCLSKTDQYQTLNALTSRAAMMALYGNTINPYLPDAANWAQQLFNGWTGRHALNALLQQPINDANVNLLNMYCNILHALDPTPSALGEYADRLFQAVLSHAQSVQMTSTAVFNDATGETAHQWLYDAMYTLIKATLDNDARLDGTVRKDLLKDLTDLQTELGIDASQENTVKTRLMLAQTNILFANMAKWMTAIGTGIAKLGGLYCASLAGRVFERASQMASNLSPKTIGLMKGCAILGLTVLYGYAVASSFVHWGQLDSTGQAQAILITAKMVTDVFGRSFSTWSEYKAARGAAPAPEPAAVAADGAALDQGIEAEMRGPQGQEMDLLLDQAEHGSPQPNLPGLVDDASNAAMAERKVQDEDLKEDVNFNEEMPPAAPAAESRAAGAWRRFNTPSGWLRAAGIVLSVVLLVVMTISLYHNWGNFTDTGKTLGIIQVITTGLAIAVDIAIFAGEMFLMTTALFLTALPIVGAVLAVIGLVACVLMMVLGVTKKEDPPPTHVETFIRNTTKSIIAAWDTMPQPAFSYSMPTTAKPGAPMLFSVSAQNGSGADVVRTSVKVTVQGGSDTSCLFSELAMMDKHVLPGGVTAASALQPGEVAAEAVDAGPPATALSESITQTITSDSITTWDSVVRGVADADTNPTGYLKLLGTGGVKQGFVVSFCGVVNQAGSNVVQIVETLVDGDTCRALFRVTRQ
ncbi:hypothetical protein QBC40DRAFT_262471 [Triangularia verruculosa]|uniref:Uncharacterized protein n=1 Tax=Triangularia verruculosa TaxID=2587418 RepID=A0AAN6XMH4_9PEZI|nr:hypothetical protein QBC40DRAFT_262471 [Triangularia verruculosa]